MASGNNEGTIEYRATVESLHLQSLEMRSAHPSVKKIHLRTEEKTPADVQGGEWLVITFDLTNVFAESEAKNITTNIVNQILNWIAFNLDVRVEDPLLMNYLLPKDEHSAEHQTQTSLHIVWHTSAPTVEPSQPELQHLQSSLEQRYEPSENWYYSAYRLATSIDEVVTRFMFLYGILLLLLNHKEGQKDVDKYIRQQEPTVIEKTRRDGDTETIYTYLRNAVGHVRPTTPLRDTYVEIGNYVEGLKELTKRAISLKAR